MTLREYVTHACEVNGITGKLADDTISYVLATERIGDLTGADEPFDALTPVTVNASKTLAKWLMVDYLSAAAPTHAALRVLRGN